MTDASAEVASEGTVGVTEQVLVPGVLSKETTYYSVATVGIYGVYTLQCQEVRRITIATTYDPSNLCGKEETLVSSWSGPIIVACVQVNYAVCLRQLTSNWILNRMRNNKHNSVMDLYISIILVQCCRAG